MKLSYTALKTFQQCHYYDAFLLKARLRIRQAFVGTLTR